MWSKKDINNNKQETVEVETVNVMQLNKTKS